MCIRDRYWENWLFAADVENNAEEAVDSAGWLNSQFHILAVRYTHKPTGFVFTNYRFRDKRTEAKSSGHDLLPVSYTHLDVYKRQG